MSRVGKAPSTIYSVVHPNGRSAELEIADGAMRYAKNGDEDYQRMISFAFHDQIEDREKRDPGGIKFKDLEFDVIRKISVAKPDFTGCACYCAYCDIGGHCRKQNRGCNL